MNEQENSEREDLEKNTKKGKHVATFSEKARKKYFFLFTKRGLQYICLSGLRWQKGGGGLTRLFIPCARVERPKCLSAKTTNFRAEGLSESGKRQGFLEAELTGHRKKTRKP